MFAYSRSLGYIGRKYSTQAKSSNFTYKKFYNGITFKEGTNDGMKEYYKRKWYYPITKYPSEYYKLEDDYVNKTTNGVYDWVKYQFKKNSIIFKVLLENYKNTAWYIYNFRILKKHYKDDIGYRMDELLKNTIFKVIEEENKLVLLPVPNKDVPRVKQVYLTPEETLLNLHKDDRFFLKDLDYDKFLPFQQDKTIHGVVYDFFKISLIILFLEELSLILLKMNLLRPPFFAHIPETLIKHVDEVVYPNMLKINTLKVKNENEVAYMNPYTCIDKNLSKKYTVEYLDLVYLDDLIFINRLVNNRDDFYRDELVYKCLNRNLFPKDYKKGSYLSLSTSTFKDLYFEYLDKRYSETLMNSKNGIHNIFDLS
ncbi:hypothetical protein ACO0R3_002466 [Hanseniaspora guilliermondii]